MMTILHFFQMLIEHIDCTERLNVQSSKSKFIFHPICLTLIVLYNIPRWTLDFWFFDHEHFVKQELSRVSRHQVLVWLGESNKTCGRVKCQVMLSIIQYYMFPGVTLLWRYSRHHHMHLHSLTTDTEIQFQKALDRIHCSAFRHVLLSYKWVDHWYLTTFTLL